MKAQSEKEITKAIRGCLKALGIFHWKHWSGPMTHPKGISDIIGIYKGKFLAIEIKRAGGLLTQDQHDFLRAVKSHGGIAFMAQSVDDVIDGLGVRDRFLL